MTRPDAIEILGQPFAVRWEDRPAVRLTEDSDHWLSGTTAVDEQLIVVRTLQGSHQQKDTVLHEVLHALIRMTGQRDRFKPNDENENHPEEPVVYALATALLQVLRANPAFVGWLTEPTTVPPPEKVRA
jgi:hypothetical protein